MDQQTKQLIENNINKNDVCLFMKGTPDAPECGFSMAVANMLKFLEVNFNSVNVLSDQKIREGIKSSLKQDTCAAASIASAHWWPSIL